MLKLEVIADTFQESIAPHLEEVRHVAARLTGSMGEAEELVSDCLAAALVAFPTLRRRDLVGAWLLQILRRKHYDRLRRRYRNRQLLDDIAIDEVTLPVTPLPYSMGE